MEAVLEMALTTVSSLAESFVSVAPKFPRQGGTGSREADEGDETSEADSDSEGAKVGQVLEQIDEAGEEREADVERES